jgi:Holliday junction DNA helicase RuvA
MIYRLRGILVEKDTEGIVLDVGGVGYRASASLGTLRALPSLGEECVIHTRMVVREDAMLLFGFAAPEERAAFDALTAVSKVGPKLALAVLSAMSPPEISEAVARGDVLKLSSVPGLGRKTAERLVLELKGQDLEAREALTGLGYSIEEAEKALNGIPPQDSVERYIKEALRRIGSRR